MTDQLREAANGLAIMSMQSDRYADDMDFRDQVDKVYALAATADAPEPIATSEDIELLREQANVLITSYNSHCIDRQQPTEWHEGTKLLALAERLDRLQEGQTDE